MTSLAALETTKTHVPRQAEPCFDRAKQSAKRAHLKACVFRSARRAKFPAHAALHISATALLELHFVDSLQI
jgi:hypothetical protein